MRFRIWGNRWQKAKDPNLTPYIIGMPLQGDLYSLGISCSKITLGLLSENVGEFPGDRITSRTFNIPGSGGFMLHERTDEVLNYFEEDNEITCFSEESELIDKIEYYLNNSEDRERIRINAYKKAIQEHTWDKRLERIMSTIYEII